MHQIYPEDMGKNVLKQHTCIMGKNEKHFLKIKKIFKKEFLFAVGRYAVYAHFPLPLRASRGKVSVGDLSFLFCFLLLSGLFSSKQDR